MNIVTKNPIRIGNVSGSIFDRVESMKSLLEEETVDAITGDWLSEINLARLALEKNEDVNKGFEPAFLECLSLAIDQVAVNKIKVVSNAGGLNPKTLATLVRNLIQEKGLNLSVAYLDGDDLIDMLPALQHKGHEFLNLDNGEAFSNLGCKPIAANAYLGGWGIVRALNEGVDIIITGRVTDAAPVIALAAWWHQWKETDFNELAQALVAGHLVECSNYVTGGNFPGFKNIGPLDNLGYPIAEIAANGDVVITKGEMTNGAVTKESVITQLVYELQGSYYVNPDVTAYLPNICITEIAKNRVLVTGATGIAPPKTAKVGISTIGGYTAEMHWYFAGLDIKEKVEMFKTQAMHYFDLSKFRQLSFDTYGSVAEDPKNQREATVHLRVFAQANEKETLEPKNFLYVLLNNTMQTYPGATCNYDFRLTLPREFIEYWPTLLNIQEIEQKLHLEDGRIIEIQPAAVTCESSYPVEHYDSDELYDENAFGETVYAPLGTLVYARSGDKFTNSNVGFFVTEEDEWKWLKSLLSTAKLRELLGEDDIGGVIERVEFKNIYAVHFLNRCLLGKGAASTSSYDCLGKNVAEYLRCKKVNIPKKFLERRSLLS